MSDQQSKFPNLSDMGKWLGKFFHDIKQSVSEILMEYKKNHAESNPPADKTDETRKEQATPHAESSDSKPDEPK